MNNDALRFLGLSKHEQSIYLALLQHPRSTGSNIRTLTRISNSRTYSALDSLLARGLVTFVIVPRGRVFSAVDPEVLKKVVEKYQKKIEQLVPQLQALQKQEQHVMQTVIYEGFSGFRNAFYRMIEECPIGETVFIIGFSNQAYKNERLRLLLSNVNTRSLAKKHRFKMILDNKQNPFYVDRKLEGISEIRFMNRGFMSPAAIDIFGDSVYLFLWDEHPYAFVIQNKHIAQGFKTYFDFLWGIAKP